MRVGLSPGLVCGGCVFFLGLVGFSEEVFLFSFEVLGSVVFVEEFYGVLEVEFRRWGSGGDVLGVDLRCGFWGGGYVGVWGADLGSEKRALQP